MPSVLDIIELLASIPSKVHVFELVLGIVPVYFVITIQRDMFGYEKFISAALTIIHNFTACCNSTICS
jgi:hypothetical protein